ncbi:MAG: LacI family transcriptional regulator [Rectinema sp.]|nr:LacI family transcriptional regulator [Rectinema sp.]
MQKITLRDIARRAGVSKTAVSFALNHPERISKKTRARIMAIAEEIGYASPVREDCGKHRQGLSIGVLILSNISEALGNPHIVQVLQGIGEECERRRCSTALISSRHAIGSALTRSLHVDGLIYLGNESGLAVKVPQSRRDFSAVIDGSDENQISIGINQEMASCELMEHVLSLGHRTIAILGIGTEVPQPQAGKSRMSGNETRHVSESRMEGFFLALAEHDMVLGPPMVRCIPCSPTRAGGYHAVKTLNGQGTMPSAIIAMADVIAIGALQALGELGMKVPDDVAIAGFDDIPESVSTNPPLTTVHQPAAEMGILAVRTLVNILEGGSPVSRILPHQLIIRGSTQWKI